jgi:hypothetical protein
MATAGYSGTPLIKKLGITDKTTIQLVNPPGDYFNLLAKDIQHQLVKKKEVPDLIHLFVTSLKEFETIMLGLKPVCQLNPAITIWVS